MSNKKKGFTLVEVLIAIVIFAIGVLSIAALGALNYMYLRVNEVQAKLHIYTESTIEDIQQWFREPPSVPPGPTRFENVWYAGHSSGDTLKTNTAGNISTTVLFDSRVGTSPSANDARIYVNIVSVGASGARQITDTLSFCVSNYGLGE